LKERTTEVIRVASFPPLKVSLEVYRLVTILSNMSPASDDGQINGTNGGQRTNGEAARPLEIAIVGAGIGGLTAAIGLRRQGHNVTVSSNGGYLKSTVSESSTVVRSFSTR
jgi:hypothetical protein